MKKSTPTLIARVSGTLRSEVEGIARRRGVPLTEVIREALEHYVASPVAPDGEVRRKADGRSKTWLRS